MTLDKPHVLAELCFPPSLEWGLSSGTDKADGQSTEVLAVFGLFPNPKRPALASEVFQGSWGCRSGDAVRAGVGLETFHLSFIHSSGK